jgi:hypothetical protein
MTSIPSAARFGSEPTICIPPIIEKTGAGSLAAITPLDLFRSTVGRYGNSPALAVQRPSTQVILSSHHLSPVLMLEKGVHGLEWHYWTFQQYWDQSMAFGKSLLHLGLACHDVVNIIGFNSVRNQRTSFSPSP